MAQLAEPDFHGWQRAQLRHIATGLLACFALIVTIGFIALLAQSSQNTTALQRDDRAFTDATKALRTAVQARQLAQIIQAQREQTITTACRGTNARHDATLQALKRVLARALTQAHTKAKRAEIRQSRKPTLLLINALAPKQDCQRLASVSTGGHP